MISREKTKKEEREEGLFLLILARGEVAVLRKRGKVRHYRICSI